MKLLQLNLKNFKGIRSFSLDTQGSNVSIFGDNASGKTTLADAFNWLLFDKDSQNKKDFEIKTLDQNNQPYHGLEHEVEGEFLLADGRTITLRKVYKEKWTKKRGSATSTLTGHTTEHFIDGVPVAQKEYTARIQEIVDEDVFKLLTNPMYFNTQLHWQDRRKILLDVCGDISDEEVIASDRALAKLPDILQGRKLEDARKVIAAKRAKINDELQKIPVRIDEVQQSLPDITGIIPEELTQKINTFKARIKEREQQIARIEGGGEVAERMKALREVEAKLLDFQNNHRAKYDAKIREKQGQLDVARDRFYDLQSDIKGYERRLKSNKEDIQKLQDRMEQLRQYWHVVNGRVFQYEESDTCPTCGQALPADQVAAAREKARAEFNREKAEELEAITADGKGLKARVGEMVSENADIEKQLKEARAKRTDAESEVTRLQKDIEALRQEADAYADSPEYKQLEQRKQELEQAIADLKSGRQGEILNARAEIRTLEEEIKAAESRLADIERAKQGEKRIEELKARERELAEEFEKLEGELYLTEQFIRTKVRLLEDRINSRFKLAKFKLFDVQINSAIAECCETIFNGVPYSGGLNNAARIMVGLDIIETLSKHYDFRAPIFIDNCEAITKLPDVNGQIIRLFVSERDKTLRVEHEEGGEVAETAKIAS
jgi:DNA repair exonuclease SbcCD ATPase subunit